MDTEWNSCENSGGNWNYSWNIIIQSDWDQVYYVVNKIAYSFIQESSIIVPGYYLERAFRACHKEGKSDRAQGLPYITEIELRVQGDQEGKSFQDRVVERKVLYREKTLKIFRGSPLNIQQITNPHKCMRKVLKAWEKKNPKRLEGIVSSTHTGLEILSVPPVVEIHHLCGLSRELRSCVSRGNR